jgi:uncharacterized protein affecting Mg2+/Co2+ transport
MQVKNMNSSKSGNPVKNQFIIHDDEGNTLFQSYNVIIVKRTNEGKTLLDERYWDYSNTTAKYRRQFLNGEGVNETRDKLKSGEYTLTNLN